MTPPVMYEPCPDPAVAVKSQLFKKTQLKEKKWSDAIPSVGPLHVNRPGRLTRTASRPAHERLSHLSFPCVRRGLAVAALRSARGMRPRLSRGHGHAAAAAAVVTAWAAVIPLLLLSCSQAATASTACVDLETVAAYKAATPATTDLVLWVLALQRLGRAGAGGRRKLDPQPLLAAAHVFSFLVSSWPRRTATGICALHDDVFQNLTSLTTL